MREKLREKERYVEIGFDSSHQVVKMPGTRTSTSYCPFTIRFHLCLSFSY